MTQRLRDELGCDAYALEPGIEVRDGYSSCVEKLGRGHAYNYTLQEATQEHPDEFIEQFDAVTVFKYNIPGKDKYEFAHALAKVLKPGGTLHITSLEQDRINIFGQANPGAFILDALSACFEHVSTKVETTASNKKYVHITCSGPRPESRPNAVGII